MKTLWQEKVLLFLSETPTSKGNLTLAFERIYFKNTKHRCRIQEMKTFVYVIGFKGPPHEDL